MPFLIAAGASLVSGLALVLGRFTHVGFLDWIGLAALAATGVACYLLRVEHPWFFVAAVLFGGFFGVYAVGRLLLEQGTYTAASVSFAVLALVSGAAGVLFFLALAEVTGWHGGLYISFLGLAVATGVLALWGVLVDLSLTMSWSRDLVVPMAISLGSPVWFFHVVLDLVAAGLLGYAYLLRSQGRVSTAPAAADPAAGHADEAV